MIPCICLIALLHQLVKVVDGCQEFNGIGNTAFDSYTESELSNVPGSGYYGIVYFVDPFFAYFLSLETPMQARLTFYTEITLWNVLAAYEEIPLDFFGRQDVSNERRFCETTNENNNNNNNTLLFQLHRNVAQWYHYYYAVDYISTSQESGNYLAGVLDSQCST